MSKRYKQRPSDIIGVSDEYPAYCFDEACIFLLQGLEDGKELKFKTGDETVKKHYTSISQFYESLGVK